MALRFSPVPLNAQSITLFFVRCYSQRPAEGRYWPYDGKTLTGTSDKVQSIVASTHWMINHLYFSNPKRRRAGALPRLAGKPGYSHIRLHDARHSHASLVFARGVHPKIVSERLGHSSVSMTLDVYSHILPWLQQAAAMAYDGGLADRKETESTAPNVESIGGR